MTIANRPPGGGVYYPPIEPPPPLPPFESRPWWTKPIPKKDFGEFYSGGGVNSIPGKPIKKQPIWSDAGQLEEISPGVYRLKSEKTTPYTPFGQGTVQSTPSLGQGQTRPFGAETQAYSTAGPLFSPAEGVTTTEQGLMPWYQNYYRQLGRANAMVRPQLPEDNKWQEYKPEKLRSPDYWQNLQKDNPEFYAPSEVPTGEFTPPPELTSEDVARELGIPAEGQTTTSLPPPPLQPPMPPPPSRTGGGKTNISTRFPPTIRTSQQTEPDLNAIINQVKNGKPPEANAASGQGIPFEPQNPSNQEQKSRYQRFTTPDGQTWTFDTWTGKTAKTDVSMPPSPEKPIIQYDGDGNPFQWNPKTNNWEPAQGLPPKPPKPVQMVPLPPEVKKQLGLDIDQIPATSLDDYLRLSTAAANQELVRLQKEINADNQKRLQAKDAADKLEAQRKWLLDVQEYTNKLNQQRYAQAYQQHLQKYQMEQDRQGKLAAEKKNFMDYLLASQSQGIRAGESAASAQETRDKASNDVLALALAQRRQALEESMSPFRNLGRSTNQRAVYTPFRQ